jgi:hypothetical protein
MPPNRSRCAQPCRSALNQRSNQTQEFLLFWSVASPDKKGSDFKIGDLSARGKIRLMPDKNPTSIGIAREQPPIPVSTEVKLSGSNRHAELAPSPLQ